MRKVRHTYSEKNATQHECGICSDVANHEMSYEDLGDGNHSGLCVDCDYTIESEPHSDDDKNSECDECKSLLEVKPVATFTVTSSTDSTSEYTKNQTINSNGYQLELVCESGCKVYAGKNNTIKLGSGSAGANFSLNIISGSLPSVKKVKFYVDAYNTKDVTVTINNASYTVKGSSTDNCYEVDVSANPTITFKTSKPSSGDCRARITKIEYYL